MGSFADGVAVKQIGAEPFRIARECVDDVILVTTDEICAAIKDIFEDTRSIAEPAGALAVAGLKRYVEPGGGAGGGCYAAIVSGANVNFDRLRHIAERAELGEQAGEPVRGDDPRARREPAAVLRADRDPLDHRVQLPLCGRRGRAHLRGRRDPRLRR